MVNSSSDHVTQYSAADRKPAFEPSPRRPPAARGQLFDRGVRLAYRFGFARGRAHRARAAAWIGQCPEPGRLAVPQPEADAEMIAFVLHDRPRIARPDAMPRSFRRGCATR